MWGGVADARSGAAWERDTVSIVHSCTKGATALCAHVLARQGLLDLEAPVAEYWPEFARNGKETATVRMMLDHSVGVPVLRGEVAPGELYDWDRMVARLEAEEPFWEPGTRHGYHMINFGWTVGELVRRVSGRSLGTFFREAVAEPLGIDFWIGLPEEHEHRVAPVMPTPRQKGEPLSAFELAVVSDRTSVSSLALANIGRSGAEQPGRARRRDRRRRRHHERPRPRRHVHAAGARRRRRSSTGTGSTACAACPAPSTATPRCASPPASPWASWSAWTTGPGPTSTPSSSASRPSATSAPAAASASPIPRSGWPSATR